MTQVCLRNVDLAYNGLRILNDVNLSIDAGEFCVFIGPSGCGKSSLLRLIAGLEPVTRGSIEIDGVTINDVPPAERQLAMVFQSYALYPHMTVFDNMAFGLARQKLGRAEIERRISEASRILQLDELLERKPASLSGGQRQRVAIGRAIVKHPKVFLFDEPLSNLDASLRVQMRIEIARLHRDLASASMIYVTHDQVEAMTLASKIVLLRPAVAGQNTPSVAQIGAPLELYHHPANLFAAGFMGTPAMNFLPASVTDAGSYGVMLALSGLTMRAEVAPGGLTIGQAVTLGVRPEHIQIGEGECRGQVSHIEALGEHSYVYLKLSDGLPAIVAKSLNEDFRVGQVLPFSLPAAELHVFNLDGIAQRRTSHE
jgi:multiple sugar transport system ATP-binding protein